MLHGIYDNTETNSRQTYDKGELWAEVPKEELVSITAPWRNYPHIENTNAWITHNGIDCPTDVNDDIEVLLKGGQVMRGIAKNFTWDSSTITTQERTIASWRKVISAPKLTQNYPVINSKTICISAGIMQDQPAILLHKPTVNKNYKSDRNKDLVINEYAETDGMEVVILFSQVCDVDAMMRQLSYIRRVIEGESWQSVTRELSVKNYIGEDNVFVENPLSSGTVVIHLDNLEIYTVFSQSTTNTVCCEDFYGNKHLFDISRLTRHTPLIVKGLMGKTSER